MKFRTQAFKLFLAGFVLVFLLSCGNSAKQDAARSAAGGRQMIVRVDGFVVKKGSISERIDVPGTLIANESTDIHPEISGRLVQLNVAEGKFVSQGTLLAKIYDGDLQAQLRKLQVQLDIANTNEQRSAQLLKIQGISKADYDASLLNVMNIQSDINITKANISKTEIRAPFNGKLGLKNISPGAFVTPATGLASIQQVNVLKLDFTVPEKYSAEMKTGREVSFTTEGSDKTYTAKVIATESSVTQDTRTLTVRALIQNKDASLIPGSFAKVILNFEPDPNALMIPSQAILPQARGKKVVIFRDSVAKFVDVTTGIRDSARVQVLSGLKPGDTVIITGLMSVKPDGKVQVGRIVNR
ncbi:MAG: efflux RND transporter periplasmic adaptor subunit [Chitinophagales bacterium]